MNFSNLFRRNCLLNYTAQLLEAKLQKNKTALPCGTDESDEQSIHSGIIGSNYRWKNFNVFIDPVYSNLIYFKVLVGVNYKKCKKH